MHEDYSFTLPPLSNAMDLHSFLQLNELGLVEIMKIPKLGNDCKGDSNPGSLNRESVFNHRATAPQTMTGIRDTELPLHRQ